ncbi:Hemolysin-3 [Tritrichomonas foetus]|uniref:Hemolysin-3 n=1 Tax=Tritrichomonas foetus TaxID=1144522 RepID=A0A1J4JNW5_9EUKA|nr:Hemolysin-3 [Tritrichomonas foetus]|eukprot:OHT00418.1 Hemolysin-3 [Tritrichomonas foetus]
MSMKELPTHWKEGEELANSVTHGIAALLSLIGGFFLVKKGLKSHDKLRVTGYVIFSLSMFELYLSSMLYHGITNVSIKKPLRYLDHCSVYILIAGSYTPFTLTTFRNCGGPKLLVAIWTIAAIGIFSKLFFFDLVEKYTCLFYVLMGWFGLVMVKQAKRVFPRKGIFWLVLGGVTYTAGTYFFQKGKTTAFCHAIFHVFILMGTVFHYICIYYYT